MIALDHLDDVIAHDPRRRRSVRRPSAALVERFGLSELQAQAILDMRLQRLTGLERDKIVEEYREVLELIERLRADPRLRGAGARDRESRSSRRSRRASATPAAPRSSPEESELSIEDLIVEEDVVVTVTRAGYIKRTPVVDLPRAAARRPRPPRHGDQGGGHGRPSLRRLDPRHPARLHLDRQGLRCSRCTRCRSRALRRAARRSSTSCRSTRTRRWPPRGGQGVRGRGAFLLFATRRGKVKRTALADYANIRRTGIIAIASTRATTSSRCS